MEDTVLFPQGMAGLSPWLDVLVSLFSVPFWSIFIGKCSDLG